MVIVVKDDVQYTSIAGEDWEVTVLSGGAGGIIKEWKWNQDFELKQSNQWDLNRCDRTAIRQLLVIFS